MHSVLLFVALVFCLAFAGMTVAVAAESGVDVFTLAALLIIVMLMIAVLGALRDPPRD
jgi:hypothetical protein